MSDLRELLREAGERCHEPPCGSGSDNPNCLGCRIEEALADAERKEGK